ncbi:MAG: hypothetical protein WDM91_22115 [Rhizomicrobium sp.]
MRILRVTLASALLCGGIAIATPAFADDASTPAQPTTTPAPAPTPAPTDKDGKPASGDQTAPSGGNSSTGH